MNPLLHRPLLERRADGPLILIHALRTKAQSLRDELGREAIERVARGWTAWGGGVGGRRGKAGDEAEDFFQDVFVEEVVD